MGGAATSSTTLVTAPSAATAASGTGVRRASHRAAPHLIVQVTVCLTTVMVAGPLLRSWSPRHWLQSRPQSAPPNRAHRSELGESTVPNFRRGHVRACRARGPAPRLLGPGDHLARTHAAP